jgi:lipopolysaccharide export LptBFGC system permease protein LptF
VNVLSWTRAYRLALRLLPAGLRREHGPAMEALFARELGRARARGRLHGARAGAAGVWDAVRRGAYERVRPSRHPDGPRVPQPTAPALLRRHAAAFAVALVALTATLLALFATRRVPTLSARGAAAGTIAEALVLAVPFIAAMTVPMAVLVAVLWEFTRLRADGTLAAAQARRGGVARLVAPVLAASVAVTALTLGWNAEVLPRANARLAAVLAGRPASARSARSGREMTVGELRAAARAARADAGPWARASAAVYEIEVQKKYALAAACVVLALAGVTIVLCVPGGGGPRGVAGLAGGAVVGAYYAVLMTGQNLAHRLVVSPAAGMWGADALVLAAALLAVSSRRATAARRARP